MVISHVAIGPRPARRVLRWSWCWALPMLACAATASGSDSVERSGDVLRIALPITALALTFKRHDAEGRPAFYKSFAAMALTTWGLKATVEKERPDGSGDDAFPSGHTAVAFQSAAFLHRRYGWRDAAWAYGLATYVAWTRVDSDLHDTADVLAGAAIGVAASYWLVPRGPGIALTPQIGPGTIGLAFNAVF